MRIRAWRYSYISMLLRDTASLLPNKKGSRVAMDRSRSRRSSEGKWLHYADPALAPMCRSATGSNVPVGDTVRRNRELCRRRQFRLPKRRIGLCVLG